MGTIFKNVILSVNSIKEIDISTLRKGSCAMYFIFGSMVIFFTMLPIVIYQLITAISGA